MIGVICRKNEVDSAKEFFHLFKTPWEFYSKNRSYDVVISTQSELPELNARLLVIYGSDEKRYDSNRNIITRSQHSYASLVCDGIEIPVYGNLLTFEVMGKPVIQMKGTSEVAGVKIDGPKGQILRVGFDLFQEIEFLLSNGQPTENAHIPTLDIHISTLRNWILDAGIPLVEIPPVPEGHNLIVCLTHDVDFVAIRQHKFDHTMWGFIYRALIGSLSGILKKKISWATALRNWKAVFSLPFVHLGLCKDFWSQFDEYLKIEKEIRSTFFLIPFKDRCGDKVDGLAQNRRASRYDIADVHHDVENLLEQGFEIGAHGIDAWHSSEIGRQEFNRIAEHTKQSKIGVRMHWLCFDKRSPRILDQVGFHYDSTFGYNDAVGFRAGTSQVFRPLGVTGLLELPLHIQDVALFSPGQMGLTENEAWTLCEDLFRTVSNYGGVITLLWHLRSLAPERLWEDFYLRLLNELKARRAWFGTAGEIVEWFRKRRAVTFGDCCFSGESLRLSLKYDGNEVDPRLMLRAHIPVCSRNGSSRVNTRCLDIPWAGDTEMEISLAG